MRLLVVAVMCAALLVPAGALAQSTDRIAILDNLGTYGRGDGLFVFGSVANVLPDAFLIMQIVNPGGNLCQIQQIAPMPDGAFLTDPIPLSGNICGSEGDYELKLFYGDYSRSSTFSVSGASAEPAAPQLLENARDLVAAKIRSIEAAGTNLDMGAYQSRLNYASGLQDLEGLYVDLWDQFRADDAMLDVSPLFRPAVGAALDSGAGLLASGDIQFEVAKQIDRSVYSAIFHYEIGDTSRAVLLINDAFAQLKNVNPVKSQPRQLSFSELEEALLNIMKKTDTAMSPMVKEEIAFILARGTAPLFSDRISDLVDMLSKSRYLDVVSRKDANLYRLVNSEWGTLRESLPTKETLDDLLESRQKVADLHAAALLIRQLDKVDRFISSDREQNSELANIIKPEWDSLTAQLELASSVQDIFDAEPEIMDMKKVTEISSRLAKSVEISDRIAEERGVRVGYFDEWNALLADVGSASTVDAMLETVSRFDASIAELREKRDPLVSLKFEFEQLKQKAELQADHKNLQLINQALRIIAAAEQAEQGSPTASRIDRAELMLTWASQVAPAIREELRENASGDARAKAGDILQRAKSIENLAELSLRKNKFLPGFTDFTDSINARLDEARNLVIQNDLEAADSMVRELFEEWRTVSGAYAADPRGSPSGYSLDELRRIEYREQLESYSNVVSAFYNSDFEAHSQGYRDLADDAYEMVDIGNFIDAESKIASIGEYLSEHLPLKSQQIIYDISYDQERDIWTLQGTVDKQVQDRREDLRVTVYDMEGDAHSALEFSDTRHGDFFTQWEAPSDPGLYVVMLQYRDAKASQIARIADAPEAREPSEAELDSVGLARQFEELLGFIEMFGGPNLEPNPRISSTIAEIRTALSNRNAGVADGKLGELEGLIERYLPVRDRAAVIEAQFDGDGLVLSGAVQKSLAFSEDLFVDIFDQRGSLVESVSLKDDAEGLFSERISAPFGPGVHVVQLEYHDLTVTDFFTVP